MFQSGEILILLLLALIVLGPTRLPEIARKLGKWSVELRAAAREITQGLEAEVGEFKKVADEIRAPIEEIKGDIRGELKQPLEEVEREIREAAPKRFEWTGPKPVSGPTPEDAMRDLEEIEKQAGIGGEEQEQEKREEDPEETGDEA